MLFACIFIIGAVAFAGCQDDYVVNPDIEGGVYLFQALKNPVERSAIVNLDTTNVITFAASYGGAKRPSGDIPVSFSVNTALVHSFNTKHGTSYSILPKNSYTLSTRNAVIPAGELSTPPLKITIQGDAKIHTHDYLLPITVSVDGGGTPVNKKLQTAYYVISVHEFILTAENHNYTAVFADDALHPQYLYFIGVPEDSTQQVVWKYDLSGDSLAPGFPKDVTDVFTLPYPQKMPTIEAAGWLYFSKQQQHPKLYFWGNKTNTYYTYNVATQTAGPLKKFSDLSKTGDGPDHWPDSQMPKTVDACFYLPKKEIPGHNPPEENFILAGKFFNRLWPGTAWRYPHSGHHLYLPHQKHKFEERWFGFPLSFAQRGVSGAYWDNDTETLHVFSNNEFIVFTKKFKAPPGRGRRTMFYAQGGARKISKVYKKL